MAHRMGQRRLWRDVRAILRERFRLSSLANLAGAGLILLGVSPARVGSPAVYLPICMLQGSGYSSPYRGRTARTQGVVTLDLDQASKRGFFLQASNCDGNPNTSDGIFVYLGERADVVQAGDRVEASGVVDEYYGETELQAPPASITVLSHDQPLPSALELNPPFEAAAARAYFEAREGMYVRVGQGRVVGPTDSDERTWLTHGDLGIERVLYGDPRGVSEVICAGDDGLFKIQPAARVGDAVEELTGALDYRLGIYCVEAAIAPTLIPADSTPEIKPLPARSRPAFEMATFNLEGMFDTVDDPLTEDPLISLSEYQRRLRKHALAIGQEMGNPAILAVQEVENLTVLSDLVARPEMQAYYTMIWQEGIDRRGLDVALLYRTDQVNILGYQSRQGCTGLVDGIEPDGNDDLENPQNTLTCDQDGDGTLDGNRLFSRPPLVVHLLARPSGAPTPYVELWLIICHFKSKVQDTASVQYTLPRRLEQARFTASLADEILASNPLANVAVLGDLNDYPDSPPLTAILERGLQNAMNWAAAGQRYSYIYQGVSQTLDYVLVYPQPTLLAQAVGPIHINADYPDSYQRQSDTPLRSSDHDPIVVSFTPVSPTLYLPLALR